MSKFESIDAIVLRDDFGRMVVLDGWGLHISQAHPGGGSAALIDIPRHKCLELAAAIQERFGDKEGQ